MAHLLSYIKRQRLVTYALAALVLVGLPAVSQAACTLREGETVPALILPLRQEIRHDHGSYFLQLLQLALDKTQSDYGACQAKFASIAKPQARLYQELGRKEGAHIIDATAGHERDKHFLAIPFPLLKGLMGYRIAFIRSQDQAAFAEVKTLDDLRRFRAGQGEDWLDVEILRLADINVTTTEQYDSLYRMLYAGRFDFFPRGAQEVLQEAGSFDTHDLAIEQTIAIAYPLPVYFYVNKDNLLLAERIATGLQRAKEDGDFERFFNEHTLTRTTFEKLDLQNRTVIYLCNPEHNQKEFLQQKNTWFKSWPEDLCSDQ